MLPKSIKFWKCKAQQGILLQTVRSKPKPALKVFGALAIKSGNTNTLENILLAHEIYLMSEADLLVETSRVAREVTAAMSVKTVELTDVERALLTESRAPKSTIKLLKEASKQYLRRCGVLD